jgi:hypothetical protein
MLLAFATAAHAENEQIQTCAPLERTNWDQVINASTTAHMYSQKNLGAVGISIFPGADLERNGFTADELGAKLVNVLKGAGVEAQCFINNSHFINSGTALGFKVNGLSITIDGDDRFNMGQVQDDKRILRTTVAEAKTSKMLLAE